MHYFAIRMKGRVLTDSDLDSLHCNIYRYDLDFTSRRTFKERQSPCVASIINIHMGPSQLCPPPSPPLNWAIPFSTEPSLSKWISFVCLVYSAVGKHC